MASTSAHAAMLSRPRRADSIAAWPVLMAYGGVHHEQVVHVLAERSAVDALVFVD